MVLLLVMSIYAIMDMSLYGAARLDTGGLDRHTNFKGIMNSMNLKPIL